MLHCGSHGGEYDSSRCYGKALLLRGLIFANLNLEGSRVKPVQVNGGTLMNTLGIFNYLELVTSTTLNIVCIVYYIYLISNHSSKL